MMRKGQVQGVERGDVRSQVGFVSQIFGLVAYSGSCLSKPQFDSLSASRQDQEIAAYACPSVD